MILRHRLIVANIAGLALIGWGVWTQRPPSYPATDAAIAHVRAELAVAERREPDRDPAELAALTVTAYVVGHLSAQVHDARIAAGDDPPTWPQAAVVEDALRAGSGYCGAATLAALALYAALGVEARAVEAWYEEDGLPIGHVTTEVRYGGAWHWYDPTWGAFYRDGGRVLSLLEAVTLPPDRLAGALVANDTMLRAQLDPGGMAFVASAPLRVTLDGAEVFAR